MTRSNTAAPPTSLKTAPELGPDNRMAAGAGHATATVRGGAIGEVCEAVSGLRAALTVPAESGLTTGVEALQAAVSRLAHLEREWSEAPPADEGQRVRALADLEALKRELRALEPVVRHGQEFWQGWARMLGLDTGYRADGVAGGIETTVAAHRVQVEG